MRAEPSSADCVPEETPDLDGAHPRLRPEQIESLRTQGERRQFRRGDVLFRAGEEYHHFFVILAGRIAVVEDCEERRRIIAVHGPGRFLGELSLLIGQTAFYTAVACENSEVLAVPVERFRRLITLDPALGELVLRACLGRRSILIGMGAGFKIVGSRYSPDTRRLREFAARNRLPHVWIDPEEDETIERLLRELHVAPEDTPVVIWHGRRVLRNPSNAELARIIGLHQPELREAAFDIVVVGAGPAGLAAAVYGASEGLDTVTIDAVATGGQAGTASKIENYLGFPWGISGAELADRATIQAEKFGARVRLPAEAVALERRGEHHVVRLSDGEEASGRTVVIATGVQYRKLDVPRLDDFEAHSVYYAATPLEARMCAGDPVAVVGGGNSAGQATLFLARFAAQVHLILPENDLTEHMSRYLADRIERLPQARVQLHSVVRELVGQGALEAVVVEDTLSHERQTVPARALFVFIGAAPHTRWLSGELELDAGGFVLTGPAAARAGSEPLLLETSRPGVFAVGDVRSGSVQRVASAVGDGAMAIRLVHERLAAGVPQPAPTFSPSPAMA
jgi:thioredoxin reductase (NADPH)